MPFFSIIIPLFNKKKFIYNVLMSVVKQSFTDFELLIIDDFSTDGSERIVTQFISEYSDKNIKYIKNEKNKGVGFTRNVGLELSTGKYVLFLDADDEISEINTLLIAKKILKNTSINYLFLTRDYRGAYIKPDFDKIAKHVSRIDKYLYEIINKDKFSFYGNLPFGGSASAIISRELASTESFNTNENMFEDWDYFMRLFNKSNPHFLSLDCIKINYDEGVNRTFRGSIPKIYNYLIENRSLVLSRKKIFWIWFNKYIRETHQFPKTGVNLIFKNLSLNYFLLKYEVRAVLNWIRFIVINKT